MTRSVALLTLAAMLWLVGGTWYYDCKIKRVCGPEAAVLPATDAAAAEPSVPVEVGEPIDLAPEPAKPEPATPASLPALSLTVHFGRKSTDLVLDGEAEAAWPQLVEAVRQGAKLEITGHADARGAPELKAELSNQRATILRDWLIAKGVPDAAITRVESREDREPIADNATAEGRAANRRAVARVITSE